MAAPRIETPPSGPSLNTKPAAKSYTLNPKTLPAGSLPIVDFCVGCTGFYSIFEFRAFKDSKI